jgi:integrase
MSRKHPPYVNGYIDCRGKARWQFRRKGFPKVPLPGLPYSAEFMKAYAAALEATSKPSLLVTQAGADRVIPRSIRALAAEYYKSAAYKALKPITQGVYRNIIEKFCREVGEDGKPHGDRNAATMPQDKLEQIIGRRADKPESANGLLKVVREMMKVAVKLKWRRDDPTQGIKKIKPKSRNLGGKVEKGFHCWSDAEIAKFEERHAIGTKARLALALGKYTGQARQDVVAMGEQHIEDEILNWVRLKTAESTGLELAIPVHPELRKIIDATPSGHLTFLATEFGAPFTPAGFGNWFRDRCNEAGLPKHCAFHGLRKAAATRLIDAGCDVVETAAITGHASLKELQRYIETRNRKKAALRAHFKVVGGRTEGEQK